MLSAQLPWQTVSNKIDRVSFNLSTGNYIDLIQHLRNLVQQSGGDLHNLQVRRDVVPQDWIELALSTGYRTITLKIRKDNLYLYGYKMSNGLWLEFNRDNKETTHLVPGSTFLGFTGSYTDLEKVAQRPIIGMPISLNLVLAAINDLAVVDEGWSRARHLAVLIVVICEATRFEELSRGLIDVMKGESDAVIEDWMMKWVRSRGHQPTWLVNWKAKVVGGGGYDHLNVYGYLKVKYWVCGVYHEVMLFQRSWERNAKVYVGKCLPLLTTVTKVPTDMPLDDVVMVEMDLMDRMYEWFVSDRRIIKVKGPPHRFGREFGNATFGKITFMENDMIKITASWNRLSQ